MNILLLADYQHSNFRELLKSFPKDKITETLITQGLNNQELTTWSSIKTSLTNSTLPERAARYWTEQDCFETLQRALRDDNKEKLTKYMPLIRAINLYICNHSTPNEMICFRKSKLSGNQLNPYKNAKKGQIYRHAAFTATSTDFKVTMKWSGCAVIKYIVPKGCLNARDISGISKFPNEKEVLFPPYTAVEVISFANETTAKYVL